MFLNQKVHNVLTSGYFIEHQSEEKGIKSNSTTTVMDLFLQSPWRELYELIGNRSMYILLTEYSIFYQLTSSHIVQIAGPSLAYLKRFETVSPHQSRFSLSSTFYHLSFSRYPGFPRHHIFSTLLQLNNDINRIEPNSPNSVFAYKRIRNEVVIILVHQIFKQCYSKWHSLSLDEEINDLRIQYHLQSGIWKRRRVPFPPRLNQCKVELAKLLHKVSKCCFSYFLEGSAPLSKEYQEYKKQWKYVFNNILLL